MARIDQRDALEVLTKARLLEIAAVFDLDVTSGFSRSELVDALASSQRAPLRRVLELLRRDELIAICRAAGMDASGRDNAHIADRILRHAMGLGFARKHGALPRAELDTVTRAELVEDVARATGLSKAQAEIAVNAVLESFVEALKSGSPILLRGFGRFGVRRRKPRTGRNPGTGAKVRVPAKRVAYFKPGKELRALLNPQTDRPQTDRL